MIYKKRRLVSDMIAENGAMFGFEGVSENRVQLKALKVGVDWCVGPPVPIPNTEVKHAFADDTCRATGRENR